VVAFPVRRKCIGHSYVEDGKELVVMCWEYRPRVDWLFVFKSLSNIFEGSSSKVEGGCICLSGGRGVFGGALRGGRGVGWARELLVHSCYTM